MSKSETQKGEIGSFLLAFAIVLIIWGVSWALIDKFVPPAPPNDRTEETRGQFGDKFGAINSLFSGFAFAGIILTLILQKRDLNETRNAMSHERFDNTFFQLLNLHIEIMERIQLLGQTGRDAFEAFNEHLKNCDQDFHAFSALQKIPRDRIRNIIDQKAIEKTQFPEISEADLNNLTESLKNGNSSFENYLDPNEKMHEDKIIAACKRSFSQNIDSFSHYFRNLYHILKFINESDLIEENERRGYSKFVRAQLSESELIVLFYNSIGKIELPGREGMELGYPKMGKLLVRYDILQNMNPRSIFHPIHRTFFERNNGRASDYAN